jgi:biopolymer transport protein ExbD
MIDVVFLLIIFFLVSSHLARQESRLKLPLPVASSGEEDPAVSSLRVTINVNGDGSLTIGNQPIVAAELAQRLASARQELGKDMEVRIRASRLTPYGDVQPIMMTCTKQGIWNVTYAVYRREQ